MDSRTAALAMLDSTIQGVLWAVLCFSLIRSFELEGYWYVVCAVVLAVEIGVICVHQKVTFPGLIEYLGYETNEKLEDVKRFNISDHWINILTMFAVVYLCLVL